MKETRDKLFDAVFDVLKAHAGAHESMRYDFVYSHWIQNPPCDEYRFQGSLGFGGKFWRKETKVSCYREDETPERLAAIEQTNKALAELKQTIK